MVWMSPPRAEGASARAPYGDASDALIRGETLERRAHLAHHAERQRIEGLRPVERDQAEPAARFDDDLLIV